MTVTSLTTPAAQASSASLWLASTASSPDREGGVSFHTSADDAWRALWAEHFDGVTPEEIHDIVADLNLSLPSLDPDQLSAAELASILEALPEFASAVTRIHAPQAATAAQASAA